jgi:hypothetical protein
MRFLGLLLLSSVCLFAQTVESPELDKAKANVEKLRILVEAGAIPRNQLQKAEDELVDAQDAAMLRRTLYGQDLTVELSDDMLAAAHRRVERREKALEDGRKLVAAAVAPEASLEEFKSELTSVRKELEIAEARAHLTTSLAEMAKAEEELEQKLAEQPEEARKIAERHDGDGIFNNGIFAGIETAFEKKFGKALPVSAMGDTATHRALGFDHRGRVDVAVNPDQPEGVWLRDYLNAKDIPYFAFRKAVPGKATGAHIHLGPMSTRFKLGG